MGNYMRFKFQVSKDEVPWEYSHTYAFTYRLWLFCTTVAAWSSYKCDLVVTVTTWPTKSKIFTIWPVTGKFYSAWLE
jgi:hypothetical protein